MSFLNEPVLVLNSSWAIVSFTPVSEAICDGMRGMKSFLDCVNFMPVSFEQWLEMEHQEEGTRWIKTASSRVAAPDVVICNQYAGMPPRKHGFSRENLIKRDRFKCQYCSKQEPARLLTIDHVLPRSRGGANSWENCVSACSDCNARKADKTPAEARMPLLSTPKKPTGKPELQIPHGIYRPAWDHFLAKAI